MISSQRNVSELQFKVLALSYVCSFVLEEMNYITIIPRARVGYEVIK